VQVFPCNFNIRQCSRGCDLTGQRKAPVVLCAGAQLHDVTRLLQRLHEVVEQVLRRSSYVGCRPLGLSLPSLRHRMVCIVRSTSTKGYQTGLAAHLVQALVGELRRVPVGGEDQHRTLRHQLLHQGCAPDTAQARQWGARWAVATHGDKL
jgi:hypothetical protein